MMDKIETTIEIETGARSEGSGTGASARAVTGRPHLGPTLLRVAWLAILLGLAMEGLLLLLTGGFGEVLGLRSAVADLVKNVSWSVFVCAGLAVGTTLSKIRVPAMGLLGFLAAPRRSRSRACSTRGRSRPSRPPAVAMTSPRCWSP
jgi:hypothetical protein